MEATNLSIKVQVKNVYGNEMIYPACEKAKVFAQLVGQKTLTHRDLSSIKQLGYRIEVVQTPVTI